MVRPSSLSGTIRIPGSKSHTIRALALSLLAGGESVIHAPLDSSDTRSCLDMVTRFGATVTERGDAWLVQGRGGALPVPDDVIDVGNSGTSLYIGLGLASLIDGWTVFTGDSQIRRRPADGLIEAISSLGAAVFSTRENGRPPIAVRGRISGGETSIEAVTSQYLSALLIAAPLAERDTIIRVPLLNEKPYVTMTLSWLEKLGISIQNDDYREFRIPGRQYYQSFDLPVPADFSSATFFIVAAAITGSVLTLEGLDMGDTQGDKEVVSIIGQMGAGVEVRRDSITIRGGSLRGGTFDLNAIPDSLPALSVAACFAAGETRFVNVAQARLKETDRIAVMRAELAKMGARVEELPDGLVVRKSELSGGSVGGHGDHRVVMALAAAGLAARGETVIDTAESAAVTFPDFPRLMRDAGAHIEEGE